MANSALSEWRRITIRRNSMMRRCRIRFSSPNRATPFMAPTPSTVSARPPRMVASGSYAKTLQHCSRLFKARACSTRQLNFQGRQKSPLQTIPGRHPAPQLRPARSHALTPPPAIPPNSLKEPHALPGSKPSHSELTTVTLIQPADARQDNMILPHAAIGLPGTQRAVHPLTAKPVVFFHFWTSFNIVRSKRAVHVAEAREQPKMFDQRRTPAPNCTNFLD